MFYLKYRPQKIKDIDNIVVRERVDKLLSSKRIAHAMLMTGPKGTGKTSTARIIAKSINCTNNLYANKGNSPEPCNKCEICKSITLGNAIDIVEIDAASNRRIDDIRELITKVKYVPVTASYKVYIIDEVHMLTTESFNALLKTLEEPPPNVIFILATTEIDRLPKTIISRCLQILVPKASANEIVSSLERITSSEGSKVDRSILKFIAQHSDNSYRDAAKIFEEAFIRKDLTIDGIKKIIGLHDRGEDLLKLIEQKDAKASLKTIDDFANRGGSFRTLIENLLITLHSMLLSKKGVINRSKNHYTFSTKEIITLIKLFQVAFKELKISPIESLPLEIAVVEYFSNWD